MEVLAVVGVRGQAIAHSIFLDGNTFNPDRRVTRVPGVADLHGSAGIRLGPLVLAYAVTKRSREYTTGPRSHTFGSLGRGPWRYAGHSHAVMHCRDAGLDS
jgi:hypothetical protein